MSTATETTPPSLDDLKPRLAMFCQRHGIAKLEVFGSVARGGVHIRSDLDFLLTFLPDVHPGWDFFSLQDELEEIIGCKVDLLTRRSLEQDENPIRRNS